MPISFVLKGRLGNQLFQYATMRNIALKNGYECYTDLNTSWHGQTNLLQNFNIKSCPHFNQKYSYNQPNDSFFFDNNIFNIKDNTIINGHFCNENYFNENEEIIKNELTIKNNDIINYTNTIINSLNQGETKIIGIHFRRGDLVSQINIDVTIFNKLVEEFANVSLKNIIQNETNFKIIIFTGGFRMNNDFTTTKNTHQNDIVWINNFISNHELKDKMIISPGSYKNNELIDYDLFSKCDYNIITYPSSFAWMSAYVNKKNDTRTYYNIDFGNKEHLFLPAKKFIIDTKY
jgi:hypothetical protein